MSNIQKKRSYILSRATFVTSFVVSIGLVVGGFFAPPMGVIDGTVLTAVGELLLFPTLLYAFRAVELGVDVKVTKGDASLEMTTDNGPAHALGGELKVDQPTRWAEIKM